MPKFKILIGDKGKTYTKEVSGEQASSLIGLKIGSVFKGDLIGLGGYELQISGGSDSDGFPMRRNFHGSSSRRLLLSPGVGFKSNKKGIRKKKRVRGDTLSEKSVQINTKVTKKGSSSLAQLTKPKEEKPEGDKEKEAPEKKEQKADKEKAKEEKPKDKKPKKNNKSEKAKESKKDEEKPSQKDKSGEKKEEKS